MTTNDRIPCHDVDAEESTLGSLLIGADIKTTDLAPGDFYSERNRWIYEACLSLHERGVNINQVTLAHEIASRDQLEGCGGAAYFSHLVSVTPTSLDYKYYAEIVKKLSIKRQIVEFSNKVSAIGYDQAGDLDADFTRIDQMFVNLRKRNAPMQIITPAERVRLAMAHYQRIENVEGGTALATGFRDIDYWLGGGLLPGDLVVVGARAGVGKTTVARTIANNIAAKNRKVLYVSLEMPTDSMTDLDVAGYIGEPVSTIRRGNFYDTREGLYSEILTALQDYVYGLQVYHISGAFDTDKIHQLALSMQVRYGLDALVVDYLGILKDRYGMNDEQRLSFISRNLKQIAMEVKVPVIVPHQLSRNLESREDKKPQLHDLRGSGAIEADADIVILMYRENYYKQIKDTTTEVIIAKQRLGPANKTVKLSFDLKHQRYCDYYEPDAAEQEAML